jgi:hypothetical protein
MLLSYSTSHFSTTQTTNVKIAEIARNRTGRAVLYPVRKHRVINPCRSEIRLMVSSFFITNFIVIIVELPKALYGTIEAAQLWNTHNWV